MPLATDRALWESIVDSDAEVPPGRTAAELLPSLLDLLGEDDPYLRDEVGYGVLANSTLGRAVAIPLVVIAMVNNFLFLPAYPLWSIVLIALDIFILWALVTAPEF